MGKRKRMNERESEISETEVGKQRDKTFFNSRARSNYEAQHKEIGVHIQFQCEFTRSITQIKSGCVCVCVHSACIQSCMVQMLLNCNNKSEA